MAIQNRPLAEAGLVSFRYPNPYGGFIMIGAHNAADALRQADRSLSSRHTATMDKLEIWNTALDGYAPVARYTEDQLKIIASRGWLCNFTGGHCPRGCASPCTYTTVSSGQSVGTDRNREG